MAGMIKSALAKRLSLYFKDMTPDRFSLSFFRGEAKLADLELRPSFIRKTFSLPRWLRITRASCGAVRCKMSLTRLKSQPVKLLLERVEVVLEANREFIFAPDTDEDGDAESDAPSSTVKQSKDAPKDGPQDGSKPAAAKREKFGTGDAIGEGIQVEIDTVFITVLAEGFSCTLTIEDLVLRNTNFKWQPLPDLRRCHIYNNKFGYIDLHKELLLRRVELALHSSDPEIQEENRADPLTFNILQPQIRMLRRRSLLDNSIMMGIQLWLVIQALELEVAPHHVKTIQIVKECITELIELEEKFGPHAGEALSRGRPRSASQTDLAGGVDGFLAFKNDSASFSGSHVDSLASSVGSEHNGDPRDRSESTVSSASELSHVSTASSHTRSDSPTVHRSSAEQRKIEALAQQHSIPLFLSADLSQGAFVLRQSMTPHDQRRRYVASLLVKHFNLNHLGDRLWEPQQETGYENPHLQQFVTNKNIWLQTMTGTESVTAANNKQLLCTRTSVKLGSMLLTAATSEAGSKSTAASNSEELAREIASMMSNPNVCTLLAPQQSDADLVADQVAPLILGEHITFQAVDSLDTKDMQAGVDPVLLPPPGLFLRVSPLQLVAHQAPLKAFLKYMNNCKLSKRWAPPADERARKVLQVIESTLENSHIRHIYNTIKDDTVQGRMSRAEEATLLRRLSMQSLANDRRGTPAAKERDATESKWSRPDRSDSLGSDKQENGSTSSSPEPQLDVDADFLRFHIEVGEIDVETPSESNDPSTESGLCLAIGIHQLVVTNTPRCRGLLPVSHLLDGLYRMDADGIVKLSSLDPDLFELPPLSFWSPAADVRPDYQNALLVNLRRCWIETRSADKPKKDREIVLQHQPVRVLASMGDVWRSNLIYIHLPDIAEMSLGKEQLALIKALTDEWSRTSLLFDDGTMLEKTRLIYVGMPGADVNLRGSVETATADRHTSSMKKEDVLVDAADFCRLSLKPVNVAVVSPAHSRVTATCVRLGQCNVLDTATTSDKQVSTPGGVTPTSTDKGEGGQPLVELEGPIHSAGRHGLPQVMLTMTGEAPSPELAASFFEAYDRRVELKDKLRGASAEDSEGGALVLVQSTGSSATVHESQQVDELAIAAGRLKRPEEVAGSHRHKAPFQPWNDMRNPCDDLADDVTNNADGSDDVLSTLEHGASVDATKEDLVREHFPDLPALPAAELRVVLRDLCLSLPKRIIDGFASVFSSDKAVEPIPGPQVVMEMHNCKVALEESFELDAALKSHPAIVQQWKELARVAATCRYLHVQVSPKGEIDISAGEEAGQLHGPSNEAAERVAALEADNRRLEEQLAYARQMEVDLRQVIEKMANHVARLSAHNES